MFDLSDEIILDGYRIPWLIWIQILIMLLLTLTILLSYFGFFAFDDSLLISSSQLGSPSNSSLNSQIAGNRDVREVDTTNGNRNNAERDGSTVKSLASTPNAKRIFHPCSYFDFAKQAFLKCLGLGSKSPDSTEKEHDHED